MNNYIGLLFIAVLGVAYTAYIGIKIIDVNKKIAEADKILEALRKNDEMD